MATRSNPRSPEVRFRVEGKGGTPKPPRIAELERSFTELTSLLYDTSVPIPVLRERVYPHLGADIQFWDPWVRASGRRQFWIGLRGFHTIVRFKFQISQLAVDLEEGATRGRVMVDGVMGLNQLVFYTYPLRTILIYEFELTKGGDSFEVTSLEEMWSFGDLIENFPGARPIYEVSRRAWGYFFTGVFWVSATVAERLSAGRSSGSKRPGSGAHLELGAHR